MKTTMNFKRPGRAMCAQGHLHTNPGSAATCDAAWRYVMRKRLDTESLVTELRAVLARAERRMIRPFDPTEQAD